MGNLHQATAQFQDALSFCHKAGYRPELDWPRCDHADMLRARDAAGDHSRAITLLDELVAISYELGMKPLMELGPVDINELSRNLTDFAKTIGVTSAQE